jgi:hypothetical protein
MTLEKLFVEPPPRQVVFDTNTMLLGNTLVVLPGPQFIKGSSMRRWTYELVLSLPVLVDKAAVTEEYNRQLTEFLRKCT